MSGLGGWLYLGPSLSGARSKGCPVTYLIHLLDKGIIASLRMFLPTLSLSHQIGRDKEIKE